MPLIDSYLVFLVSVFEFKNKIQEGELLEFGQTMGCDTIETKTMLDIIVADGLLDKRVIGNKYSDIVDYSAKPELRKFIFDQGG